MGTLNLPLRLKTLGVLAVMNVASQVVLAAPVDRYQQTAAFTGRWSATQW